MDQKAEIQSNALFFIYEQDPPFALQTSSLRMYKYNTMVDQLMIICSMTIRRKVRVR